MIKGSTPLFLWLFSLHLAVIIPEEPPPLVAGLAAFYEEFTPPPRYREIHREAEACTGERREFGRVVWVEAPGRTFSSPSDGSDMVGYWIWAADGRDTIVIASAFRNYDWIIKHELVHYLIQAPHSEDVEADRDLFGRRCRAMWGFLEEQGE